MEVQKDLLYVIEKLISLNEYWRVNYYLRCMKKQPHGGVAHIFYPNIYLRHYDLDLWTLFCNEPEKIPFFMNHLVDTVLELYHQCNVDFEELLQYCFGVDCLYTGYRLLRPKSEYEELNKSFPLLWAIIDKKLRYQDYFEIDTRLAIYPLICCLVQERLIQLFRN